MAKTQEKPVKEKKETIKKVLAKRVRKTPNPNQKRGQPTAAARVIASPYIKFGWHKPLSGEVKEAVQRVSSIADSMYMLQIDRERPIESLSLRNGIFWEQRQLSGDKIVSTPAVDHIDLFPQETPAFQETIQKLGKRWLNSESGFSLHYIFSQMRTREFLLLPVEIDGHWVTVIARMNPKSEARVPPAGFDEDLGPYEYLDREVTDFAIVDPQPNDRESRHESIKRRLTSILAQGCIQLPTKVAVRDIAVPEIAANERWKTGLVAYAISREFLRRLKVLQWRRERGDNDSGFLWAPFEEHYNFDAYRQNLMSACAHQTIEMSGFQVRMALDVPSEDSNYYFSNLSHVADDSFFQQDEKWEVFQTPTHTFTVPVHMPPHEVLDSDPRPDSPSHGPRPDSPSFHPPPPSPPRFRAARVQQEEEDYDDDMSPISATFFPPEGTQEEEQGQLQGQLQEENFSPASPISIEQKWPSPLPLDVGVDTEVPLLTITEAEPETVEAVEEEAMEEAMNEEEEEVAIVTTGDAVAVDSGEYQLSDAESNAQNAPDAPMGDYELSSQIPGLSLTAAGVEGEGGAMDLSQGTSRKRTLSDVEEDGESEDDESPSAKRLRI